MRVKTDFVTNSSSTCFLLRMHGTSQLTAEEFVDELFKTNEKDFEEYLDDYNKYNLKDKRKPITLTEFKNIIIKSLKKDYDYFPVRSVEAKNSKRIKDKKKRVLAKDGDLEMIFGDEHGNDIYYWSFCST